MIEIVEKQLYSYPYAYDGTFSNADEVDIIKVYRNLVRFKAIYS